MSHSPDIRELKYKEMVERMKENEIDYKKEYDNLKRLVKDLYPYMSDYCQEKVDGYFPDIKETENEMIRKDIITFLRSKNGYMNPGEDWNFHNRWLPWLEKQGEKVIHCPQNHQDINKPNDCVGLEYFNLCEGFYIDLGLPSGTLWKDANEEGYYTYINAVETFGKQLPTKEQWVELKDKCKWEWLNNGYKVTGPNGKSIFLPADGIYNGGGVHYRCTDGYYLSGNFHDVWSLYFNDDSIYLGYGDGDYGRSVRLVK